ncbi:hypothetical protein [Brooklawnia cerclae]|uniref:Uncharacterized protein n=1 Tax=Brooklawnia cerclae TaxID=349934 RepID=A0ABX0SIK9_9ACTN|nr:hypothetical protein [Brooklawnia cerclae]NIH57158.1 hypothetical protein [Brooklawnia cerclae]
MAETLRRVRVAALGRQLVAPAPAVDDGLIVGPGPSSVVGLVIEANPAADRAVWLTTERPEWADCCRKPCCAHIDTP